MSLRCYVLVDRQPVAVELEVWARTFETKDRHVATDKIDDVLVSTVFLGLDHGYDLDAPVLFETMIFGGEFDGAQERYCTWDEAEAGHARWKIAVASTTNNLEGR